MATTDKKTTNNAGPKAFTYQPYKQSNTVTQAQTVLQNHMSSKPGAYQSQWQSNVDAILGQIQNRKPFEYNVNSDALYQQYKDQYVRQGQQAMMDTMGQAVALTGGYGNSYAQTAGQQTYQGYLQQLNDKVPELYQLALNQYNQETSDLYNQYGLYSDRENQDYGRYQDMLNEYYANLDRYTEDARYAADTDYDRYMDAYDMAYGQYRDSVADWQWQTQFDTSNKQWQAEFDEDKRRYDQEYQLALEKAYGSGSGTGNGNSTEKYLYDSAEIEQPGNLPNVATYGDAVAYLKTLGYDSSQLLTGPEWNNLWVQYQKTGSGSAAVVNNSTYKAYLQDFIEGMIAKKGKFAKDPVKKASDNANSKQIKSTSKSYPTNGSSKVYRGYV